MHHSFEDHPQFSGAKIALLYEEHVVTYRRDDKPGIPFPGFWDLPGGGREGTESPVDCALRELEEEFSITVPPARIGWLKLYPSSSMTGLPSCFLVARVDALEIARIRFGSEGECWRLMRVADFLSRQDVPPPLQRRLADYLDHQAPIRERESPKTLITAPLIRVSALFRERLSSDLKHFRPSHVVSLLDPHIPSERIPIFDSNIRVLQQHFFDGDSPRALPPTETIIREIITFLAEWLEYQRNNSNARLLIHCHMGASRSTAVAMIALALVYGPGRESDAFAQGLAIMNKPWPNLKVVQLADQQLGRGGALLEQLLAYRARYPQRLKAYGRLNRIRGWT